MVDIIMGANVERLNQWLQDNPNHEFRARKSPNPPGEGHLKWHLVVVKIDPGSLNVTMVYDVWAASMGDGLKSISRWVYEKNQLRENKR